LEVLAQLDFRVFKDPRESWGQLDLKEKSVLLDRQVRQALQEQKEFRD
jgi:hypothetical protein